MEGRHVKVLGRAPATMLASLGAVRGCLTDLVAQVGMRPLGAPVLYEVEAALEKLGLEPFEDEGGVTGVLVLSTSHVAIHTWPLRNLFVLDLFSCRDFDPEVVRRHLRDSLGATKLELSDLSFALAAPEGF